MPAALMSKDDVLARLMDTFRDRGYEGASLTELSAATGLTRSSLYHYFPGGKEQMGMEVLAHLDRELAESVYEPLRSSHTPARKLGAMIDAIDAFYEGGREACLLERLCTAADRGRFSRPLRQAFTAWMQGVEALCSGGGTLHPRPVQLRLVAGEALRDAR